MTDLAVEIARVGEQSRNNERRIDAHEDLCAERYGEITGSFTRVHERLDRIMIGVICVLLSVVGALLTFGVSTLIK